MIETLLIVWRESLEAALIVGILLTFLARSGETDGIRWVWAGTVAAVLAAVLCAVASNGVVTTLGPDAQELVQVGILLVAVGVLTWMVLWMHRHARDLRGELHRRAGHALATGRMLGLATIAFAAVFREGVETVLFLWGVVVHRSGTSPMALVAAGAVGLALAIATAWVFFRGFRFLDLPTFFRATGILLLLVAGGLLTSAANQLIGIGYLPPLVPQVWNSGWLVRDDSVVGLLLSALIGYRSRPSLLEVLVFVTYVVPVAWMLRRVPQRPPGASSARGLPARSAA
ncbi:MAG: FTR1 family protein [Candidatus Binatia bacterium]